MSKFREYLETIKESSKQIVTESWIKNEKLNNRLYKKYIPSNGKSKYLETELLRASNKIIYDHYNNGWGGNNISAALDFLHRNGFFKKISFKDIATIDGGNKFENYMEKENDKIIKLILEKEKTKSFTKIDYDYYANNGGFGLTWKEWDNMTGMNDEEEEEEEEEEY
jgi:hypothetical protein